MNADANRHPDAQKIVALYERHAHDFDRERSKIGFERDWLERFRGLLRGTRVLDIGCGVGEPIASNLIHHGLQVTGIDSSDAMISICSTRFPDQTWRQMDMRQLDLATRFDGLLAWNSFFHLCPDDQRAMFARFAAHAKKGAPLMFTSGPGHGEALGTWHGEALYHSSLAPEEYRSLLNANGFEVHEFTPNDPNCNGHTVWLASFETMGAA